MFFISCMQLHHTLVECVLIVKHFDDLQDMLFCSDFHDDSQQSGTFHISNLFDI